MPSIELRVDGSHRIACDWGVIDNPDPTRGEIGPLMLITRKRASEIAVDGYVYLTRGGRNYVWELFDTHWWDGKGRSDILIGRWPD